MKRLLIAAAAAAMLVPAAAQAQDVGSGLYAGGQVGYQESDLKGRGTEGDMLYGIGGEFGVSERTAFRVIFDTVGFDTTRITAGVTFHF